ncbi:MAG TPA: rhodanese-like domain-containing protein, partial [Fodinibius sp.]|nr:rhodanese-like domain-containing protein [Fodinibius sp.]
MSDALKTQKVLSTTDWAAAHLNDENVRFVEVDVDTESYESGHIPGAVGWNWKTQLQDQLRRTISSKEDFES